MAETDNIIVPAKSARAFDVGEGERFRIVAPDGPQVGDAVFMDQHDHEETYSSDLTVYFNQLLGTGDLWQVKTLYSRPPGIKELLTVTEDTIGHHYPLAGGMCSQLLYEIRDDDPDHPNCADNLLAALNDHGVGVSKVPEVFNIGMNVSVSEDGFSYNPPEFGAGDYIELRAERDLVVALSACPNDTTIINDYEPKRLKVERNLD